MSWATIVAIVSILVAIPVAPAILNLYAGSNSVNIPADVIMLSLIEVLVVPGGQLTRLCLNKKLGEVGKSKS